MNKIRRYDWELVERKDGEFVKWEDVQELLARHQEQLVEQRCIGHGEGQEHTIADVNAGRIDDLIAPRLSDLLVRVGHLEQLLAPFADKSNWVIAGDDVTGWGGTPHPWELAEAALKDQT